MEYFVTYFFMGYPNCKRPNKQEKQQDKDCSKCKEWAPVSKGKWSRADTPPPLLCHQKPEVTEYCRCSVGKLTPDQKKLFERKTKIQTILPDYGAKGFPGFALHSRKDVDLPDLPATALSDSELSAVYRHTELKDKFDEELKDISDDELKDRFDNDVLSTHARTKYIQFMVYCQSIAQKVREELQQTDSGKFLSSVSIGQFDENLPKTQGESKGLSPDSTSVQTEVKRPVNYDRDHRAYKLSLDQSLTWGDIASIVGEQFNEVLNAEQIATAVKRHQEKYNLEPYPQRKTGRKVSLK